MAKLLKSPTGDLGVIEMGNSLMKSEVSLKKKDFMTNQKLRVKFASGKRR